MVLTRSTISPGLSAVSTQSKLQNRGILLFSYSCALNGSLNEVDQYQYLLIKTKQWEYDLTFFQEHRHKHGYGSLCPRQSENFQHKQQSKI